MFNCFGKRTKVEKSIWIEADTYDATLFETELFKIIEEAGKDPNLYVIGEDCKCDFVFVILKIPARKPFLKPHHRRLKTAIRRCSEDTHAFILFTNVAADDGWCSYDLDVYLSEECGSRITVIDRGLRYEHQKKVSFTIWSSKGSLSAQQRTELITLFL